MIVFKSMFLKNFMAISRLDFEFDDPGFHGIFGENGVGKTTIFEGVTWIVYGVISKGGKVAGDSVINSTVGNNCIGNLVFEKGGQEYFIARARAAGTKKDENYLIVTVDGEEKVNIDLRGRKTSDTNDEIGSIIGMDYEAFCRSVYFPQEGIIPFGKLTDAKLKEFFLEKVLHQFAWIRDAQGLVDKDKKVIEYEIDKLVNKIDPTKSRVSELEAEIESLEQQEEQWKMDHRERLSDASNEEALVKSKIHMLESQKQVDSELLKKLNTEIETAVNKRDAQELELKSINSQVEQCKEQVVIAQQAVNQTELRLKEKEKDLAKVDDLLGKECPSCDRPFGEVDIEKYRSKIVASIPDFQEKLQREKAALTDKEAELVNLLAEHDSRKSELVDFQKAVNNKIMELSEQKGKLVKDEDLEEAWNTLSKLTAWREKIEVEPCLATRMLKRKREDLRLAKSQLLERESELSRNIESLELIKPWSVGFSSKGLQSFILDTITPLLNKKIAEYLHILSDGDLQAAFQTVVKLKSGEYREKFRLNATNTRGVESYAYLSGGEKKRIDLATALALGDLHRSYENNEPQLLVLDEVFTNMDEDGKTRILQLILDNYKNRPVYVISHEKIPEHYFDTIRRVRKERGFAQIEKH